jgi:hypothetical protein
MFKHVGCCSVTVALASLLSIASANASAVFSTSGGTSGTLSNLFNGFNWGTGLGSGITNATPVEIYGNGSTGGLLVSPEFVSLTFTFEGASAAYTNLSQGTFTFGNSSATQLDNQTSALGTSTSPVNYDVGPAPGLVPFTFESLCGGNCGSPPVHLATNGGFIDPNLEMAIDVVSATTAYIFLEDIAIGGDQDFNDMIVRVDALALPNPNGGNFPSPTPLPGALALFVGGLSMFGLVAGRKKRKTAGIAAEIAAA